MSRLTRVYLCGALLVVLLASLAVLPAMAQGQTLDLSLHRDFGVGIGSRIQGRFTLSASGPQDLAAVTFLLDGQPIGTADSAPFRVSFDTGAFPLGQHTLSAVGRTTDGRTLTSADIPVETVSPALGIGVVLIALLVVAVRRWPRENRSGNAA